MTTSSCACAGSTWAVAPLSAPRLWLRTPVAPSPSCHPSRLPASQRTALRSASCRRSPNPTGRSRALRLSMRSRPRRPCHPHRLPPRRWCRLRLHSARSPPAYAPRGAAIRPPLAWRWQRRVQRCRARTALAARLSTWQHSQARPTVYVRCSPPIHRSTSPRRSSVARPPSPSRRAVARRLRRRRWHCSMRVPRPRCGLSAV
mmetsp:Transcript_13856/g.35706  ORF Transcript_13856/g.35706 Transcript_13856/m.35706 type:complete len:202 (+) Transcript_13856:1220-1825(+)